MEKKKIFEYLPYFVISTCMIILGIIAAYIDGLGLKISLMVVAVGLGVLMLRRTRVMEESK